MRTYEITLKHDKGLTTFRVRGENLQSALDALLIAEKAPPSAFQYWRVIPTKKEIQKTKNLIRGI